MRSAGDRWPDMDMSFNSNAEDDIYVVMDCGDLKTLYRAAGETGYRKRMAVMDGLREPI